MNRLGSETLRIFWKRKSLILALSLLCAHVSAYAEEFIGSYLDEPIVPIPEYVRLDQRKMELGKKLFNDPRLSRNNVISCASCHKITQGGADNVAFSFGVDKRKGGINAPSVFNVAYHFAFFWDGRAATLQEQMDGPIHNPDEMDTDWSEVSLKLAKDPDYMRIFREIYSMPPTEQNIKDAIVTFEHSLITPDAPFDKYLRGDAEAISSLEKRGYRLFKELGCVSCHQGMNVGGNMFQQFGIIGDYFEDRGSIRPEDLGRYNVTGDELDKFVFKVPSLRNVALTAPYFHDGSTDALEDAIDIMGKYQLGRLLSEEEKTAIAAFLRTLTGEYKEGESVIAK